MDAARVEAVTRAASLPAVTAPATFNPPSRLIRSLAAFGATSVAASTLAIGLLHVLPATRHLNPLSVPISKYALTGVGWLFDAGVLVLTLGLVAVAISLALARCLSPSSRAFAAMIGCCVGLVALVIFPDRTSGKELTAVGWVHWTAAMVAFGGLAAAPALLGRRHRTDAGCSRLPRAARWLSFTAGGWFVVLLIGSALEVSTTIPVWRVGGVVERVLAVTEMALAVLLAAWAWHGCRCRELPPYLPERH